MMISKINEFEHGMCNTSKLEPIHVKKHSETAKNAASIKFIF